VDDLLGIWGDPRTTGKPVGSDLRARKKSAPVVAALAAGGPAAARLARLYLAERELDDDAVTTAAALIEEAGGRDWSHDQAQLQMSIAGEQLDGLDLDPAARTGLDTLTTMLMTRDH
jgi:geranylgeranyl diphosphate synthase type I